MSEGAASLRCLRHRSANQKSRRIFGPLGIERAALLFALRRRGGAFVTANVERQKLNGYKLARLGMVDGLSDWERAFIRDISERRKLSPKQQQIIDRLCADYLETAVVS